MNTKKKLFSSDDFDKKKKLFTPSDFDKESEEVIPIEKQKEGNNPPASDKKSPKKIWIGILFGIFAVICAVICYNVFSKFGDSPDTEKAQESVIVEKSTVTTGSVSDKEDASGEVIPTPENEVSNNADGQEAKVSEEPTTDNKPQMTTSTTRAASSVNISSDVEAEAMKVIRGDYGVGQERKDKLGNKYQTIQSRVNELKREGIF